MLQKVLEIIKKEELMRAGELVVAGVSGGADSICLLSVLFELKDILGIRLAAVHVHHGIRGKEADEDAQYVRLFCEKKQIPCKVFCRDVPALAKAQGMSEEEAGRKVRYECFKEALEEWQGDRVAVAHNRNDNAETVLFHLFRGSGLKGLSGMESKGRLPGSGQDEKEILVRPLLSVSRAEIEAYLGDRGISYRKDSTNESDIYSRNRIRRRILPQAELVNEEAVLHIVQAADMIGKLDRWMEKMASEWIEKNCFQETEGVLIPCRELKDLEEVQAGRILRRIIEKQTGSLKDITKRHIDSVLGLLEKQPGRAVDLPGRLTARKRYGQIWIGVKREKGKEEGVLELVPSEEEKEAEIFGCRFQYRKLWREGNEKIPENRYTKWFDYDTIKSTVQIRPRRSGDFLTVTASGGRKTLKKYLIDEKIPAGERDRLCLLADGSHILWVVGHRISEAYKVTEKTSRVLKVQVMED